MGDVLPFGMVAVPTNFVMQGREKQNRDRLEQELATMNREAQLHPCRTTLCRVLVEFATNFGTQKIGTLVDLENGPLLSRLLEAGKVEIAK